MPLEIISDQNSKLGNDEIFYPLGKSVWTGPGQMGQRIFQLPPRAQFVQDWLQRVVRPSAMSGPVKQDTLHEKKPTKT